jgi:glutaredoxin
MNGCGHCDTLLEFWDTMIKEYKMDNPEDNIQYETVIAGQSENSDLEKIKTKYNVNTTIISDGYPTIFKILLNRDVEYYPNDTPRSPENIIKWMKM